MFCMCEITRNRDIIPIIGDNFHEIAKNNGDVTLFVYIGFMRRISPSLVKELDIIRFCDCCWLHLYEKARL